MYFLEFPNDRNQLLGSREASNEAKKWNIQVSSKENNWQMKEEEMKQNDTEPPYSVDIKPDEPLSKN